eukprot:1184741-Prorocentrum_minimum.AAC.2
MCGGVTRRPSPAAGGRSASCTPGWRTLSPAGRRTGPATASWRRPRPSAGSARSGRRRRRGPSEGARRRGREPEFGLGRGRGRGVGGGRMTPRSGGRGPRHAPWPVPSGPIGHRGTNLISKRRQRPLTAPGVSRLSTPLHTFQTPQHPSTKVGQYVYVV